MNRFSVFSNSAYDFSFFDVFKLKCNVTRESDCECECESSAVAENAALYFILNVSCNSSDNDCVLEHIYMHESTYLSSFRVGFNGCMGG